MCPKVNVTRISLFLSNVKAIVSRSDLSVYCRIRCITFWRAALAAGQIGYECGGLKRFYRSPSANKETPKELYESDYSTAEYGRAGKNFVRNESPQRIYRLHTFTNYTPVVNWCRKSSGHVDKFHLRSSKLDTRNADGWLSEINLQLRQKKNLEQNYRQPWAIRSYSVTTMGVIIANCPSRNRLRDDNDSNSRLQNKYERPDVNYNVITVPERVIFGAQPIGSD